MPVQAKENIKEKFRNDKKMCIIISSRLNVINKTPFFLIELRCKLYIHLSNNTLPLPSGITQLLQSLKSFVNDYTTVMTVKDNVNLRLSMFS